MRKATLLAAIVVGLAVADTTVIGRVPPDTPSDAALSGTVTSPVEGAMEGVLVGAKKAGSTVATWVVSDARGEYRFPRDRMEPGRYAVTVRAVGYELRGTSVEVTAQPARLDLPLDKVTRASALAMQMSNAELILSAPGTPVQKTGLGGCVNCHTLQRVLFSRFTAEEWMPVIQRMARHTNNSSPLHPWVRPIEGPIRAAPPSAPSAFATYLASVNLSARDSFDFPLTTLPRPHGKATQVIYTVYELPRPDASPHDTVFDAQGNVWYSDFNSQFFGKLDPKTGKVTEYTVPQNRLGQIAQGGLQIDIDRQGRIYYGNMSQMQIARLDPKTGKLETFRSPLEESSFGDAHLTMVDPAFQHLDGKLWANVAFDTGEAGGTWHIDLATNTWTRVTYPAGSPSARAYDVVADSKNNSYGMQMTNDKLWKTDGKTLQTVWYDFPTKGAGCRRGHIDAQDRLWCGVFHGNRLAMFDPKTEKITEWTAPTPWTRPYDAQFDDRTYAWTAGMDNDLALRLNVQTGEFTEYLLPHETNVRHVEVQKSGALSSFWLGNQHGNTLIHIEPLAP
ncbi:MAG: carboxypeptidase regulatory-like domain-containing protein [Acidobacteria bacterium]|nr:carboxypeptidase regulatory-like domain-containing protein [Acidobacteriota bacterium]